jgi:hypothetical protein
MHKLKLIFIIIFFLIGCFFAYLSFTLDSYASRGRGTGVSYNDGKNIALGIISGFSFLSCAILFRDKVK